MSGDTVIFGPPVYICMRCMCRGDGALVILDEDGVTCPVCGPVPTLATGATQVGTITGVDREARTMTVTYEAEARAGAEAVTRIGDEEIARMRSDVEACVSAMHTDDVAALLAERDALLAEVATARVAALKEAARVCETLYDTAKIYELIAKEPKP